MPNDKKGHFQPTAEIWLSRLQKSRFTIPGPTLPRRNLFYPRSSGFGLVLVSCPSKEVMYVCGPRLGLSSGLIASGSDTGRGASRWQAQAH